VKNQRVSELNGTGSDKTEKSPCAVFDLNENDQLQIVLDDSANISFFSSDNQRVYPMLACTVSLFMKFSGSRPNRRIEVGNCRYFSFSGGSLGHQANVWFTPLLQSASATYNSHSMQLSDGWCLSPRRSTTDLNDYCIQEPENAYFLDIKYYSTM
jgi:hypothetical protein